MKIKPASRVRGRVAVPGDKSISHRAAIISSLARGQSKIYNFSSSEDCASTLRCLRQLGVSVTRRGDSVVVESDGRLRAPVGVLDCGNSGSTMRMLAGVLAGHDLTAELTGDQSLRARPMIRVIEPLERMGARIVSSAGKPPLEIQGRSRLEPIDYEMPVASAQVKTAVLLAALNADGTTTIVELQQTRDHTESLLNWFQVPIRISAESKNATRIEIDGVVQPSARDVNVPGDISSAAFLIGATAVIPGSQLSVVDVGLNPTRTQFLTLLQSWGLDIRVANRAQVCNEPVGEVLVVGQDIRSDLHPEQFNAVPAELIPQLIDELPLIAVLGTQVRGGVAIRGAQELRYKETDRIIATVKNLRAMGVEVEELDDGLVAAGPQKLRSAEIHSFGDHRIAMAFTVAALLANEESILTDTDCVSISFPEFFHLLASIVEN